MNEPAFPFKIRNRTEETTKGVYGEDIPPYTCNQYVGMTLRDYFAGQALVGFIACSKIYIITPEFRDSLSKQSYLVADAMLAERANNKESEQENANS